jgi:phosphatidylglycerophosphate synthase
VIAHLLSAARLTAAAPFGLLLEQALARPGPGASSARAAAALLALAVASDLADGALARRAGRATEAGRALDHGADCAFVLAGLGAAALKGLVPWVLPGLIALAFLQYALDSWVLPGAGLRPNRLGRLNGVLYFALLGAAAAIALGAAGLAPALRGAAWLMVGSTALSMLDRARPLDRTARAARGAGTADPGRR